MKETTETCCHESASSQMKEQVILSHIIYKEVY
jgi:hypothetical protein